MHKEATAATGRLRPSPCANTTMPRAGVRGYPLDAASGTAPCRGRMCPPIMGPARCCVSSPSMGQGRMASRWLASQTTVGIQHMRRRAGSWAGTAAPWAASQCRPQLGRQRSCCRRARPHRRVGRSHRSKRRPLSASGDALSGATVTRVLPRSRAVRRHRLPSRTPSCRGVARA
ncbi:hypothetical protein D1007_28115 [Hordeum vulgare]|nr:hypothetical protein D1007_28115 [Hordeum vulgare]